MFRLPFLSFSLHVLLPLIVGIFIYFLFRGVPFLGLHSVLNISKNNILIVFLLFNLPDGLWLYAFLSVINQIWGESKKGLFWLITVFILTISSEFLQRLHIIPGTFDWLDIITYSLTFLIFNLFHRNLFLTNLYLTS